MCGIVGYLGPLSPKDVIVEGLKKLEYRGYDSSGVAIFDKDSFKRVRAEGKLKNLEAKLIGENFSGHVGIGHTRWATHGGPSERNAHPHSANGISLVHNGIIENYAEIKEELLNRGAQINSDTDSELVAHLLAEDILNTQDLKKSVLNVLKLLQGAYSILAVWDQKPDELVAFKDGPPLIVGLGKNEFFIVSDIQAALHYTKDFVYLDDKEVVFIHKNKIEFLNDQGQTIDKKPTHINWDATQIEKKGFSHFMLKEIYEQPQAVSAAMAPHIDPKTLEVKLSDVGFDTKAVFAEIKNAYIIACGTSYYAGMVGKYYIEKAAGLSVQVDIASEFRYRNPILSSSDLVITVSQSGETADTLAAIRLAKEKGCKTLSICNVKNSTIDREAHGHLYMNSGPEIGVASTKAFVSTMAVFNCLAVAIAQARHSSAEKNKELQEQVQALLMLPNQLEVVLGYDKYFADAAQSLSQNFKGFLYMGRGVNYPVAMEGALKLKELAYLHAEGYAAGEMKHGPLALIDERMAIIMVAPNDELFDKTLSNLEEARARGGKIISIGTGENERLKRVSDRYLGIPKAHWTTNPVLAVVPLQLMAFHLADSLGNDVDQPRNLAKSVTVE